MLGSCEVVLSVHLPGLVYGEAEPVSMTLAVGLTVADKLFNKLKPLAPPDVQVAPFSNPPSVSVSPILLDCRVALTVALYDSYAAHPTSLLCSSARRRHLC